MKTINLKDILSIAGKGGLFKFIAQARNGIIVESLEDKKRHVAPSTARVSSLEDIAIFTQDEEVPLADLFMKIYEKTGGEATLSHKSAATELKAEFEDLLPDYDEERVYVSDIKKVFQWFNQLQSQEMLEVIDKEEEGSEEGTEEGEASKKADPENNPSEENPAEDQTDKDE